MSLFFNKFEGSFLQGTHLSLNTHYLLIFKSFFQIFYYS